MKPVIALAELSEGEMTARQVDGVSVLVCHVEGQFYALHNECTHAHQALHTGKLTGHQLKCPLHGGRFDVRSGACQGAPATEPLTTFPVTLEGGKVHVTVTGIEPRATPKFGPFN
ncbi:MAG: non-heme iron oxygenase ferredoxin subunit [Gammaproteobacteria bacterium]|nr:non-heme iron oxygenase ferredoxin subunit [Gammaproteobacteria bacterium]